MNTTATLTTLDVTTIEEINSVPECEGTGCDAQASLAIYCSCGCVLLACLRCREASRVYLVRHGSFRCRHCKTRLSGRWLSDVVLSEVPL